MKDRKVSLMTLNTIQQATTLIRTVDRLRDEGWIQLSPFFEVEHVCPFCGTHLTVIRKKQMIEDTLWLYLSTCSNCQSLFFSLSS